MFWLSGFSRIFLFTTKSTALDIQNLSNTSSMEFCLGPYLQQTHHPKLPICHKPEAKWWKARRNLSQIMVKSHLKVMWISWNPPHLARQLMKNQSLGIPWVFTPWTSSHGRAHLGEGCHRDSVSRMAVLAGGIPGFQNVCGGICFQIDPGLFLDLLAHCSKWVFISGWKNATCEGYQSIQNHKMGVMKIKIYTTVFCLRLNAVTWNIRMDVVTKVWKVSKETAATHGEKAEHMIHFRPFCAKILPF